MGNFFPFFIKLNDEKLFEEWILFDWSEQAKIQEYKKELSTTDKKRKIIMITFGMLTLRISEKKILQKNWGTLWTEITRSPVFSHRKQVNIQSAIYTCTYTYNYDKVRASYIYARKKNLLGCPMVNYFAVENTSVTLAGFLSSACKLEFFGFLWWIEKRSFFLV